MQQDPSPRQPALRLSILRSPSPSSPGYASSVRSHGDPSHSRSPLRRSVGPADEDYFSASPASTGGASPRLPTHRKSVFEMNALMVDDARPTDAREGTPFRRSRSESIHSSSSDSTKLPMQLEPLATDVLLPFMDRSSEVSELLQEPCNVSIVKSLHALDHGRVWRDLEPALKAPRSEMDDAAWIMLLSKLVRRKSGALWVGLRDMLGAADILENLGTDVRGTRFSTLAECDRILQRTMSFESVFTSDTESTHSLVDTTRPPLFGTAPHDVRVSPVLIRATLPRSAHPSPRMHTQHLPRNHFRTGSHGGAIAAPAPTMTPISEDAGEPVEEGRPDRMHRRTVSFEPASFRIGTAPARRERSPSVGLRIEAEPASQPPSATDDAMAGRRRRPSYSFGTVEGDGLGFRDVST